GKITLRNDSAQPQKTAVLQISSSLNWRSIRIDGKPVQYVLQPYTSDIDHTFTAVRGAGYVAWYPITTESADFSEGNSLFEVVDRWKAREAWSEFKARVTMQDSSSRRTPTLLCGAD